MPDRVVEAVLAIADAAESGNTDDIEPFLSSDFESPYDDPLQAISTRRDVKERLKAVLATDPGLRRSPLGNGAVQEIWVYPRMALERPEDWTEDQIRTALDSGIMTDEELALSQEEGAYRAFSAGFDPTGNWVFFVSERVSPTPHP